MFDLGEYEHDALRDAMRRAHRADETITIAQLQAVLRLDDVARSHIAATAADLIADLRSDDAEEGPIEALLREYDLASDEGVVLMTLAEALLRIPDAATRDLLIRDKLSDGAWARHVGRSDSALVNLSSWALALTGRAMRATDGDAAWQRLATRLGEPLLRGAMLQAMRVLGSHFVLGETIDSALARAASHDGSRYRYSYDMLGEAAHTAADASRYLDLYRNAVTAIGAASTGRGAVEESGLSIKLSALHPRYELAQRRRVLEELYPRLLALVEAARAAGIGCTIDAEEADRLDLSLDCIARLIDAPSLAGWDGLGLAVQAYSKRILPLLDWLAERAARGRRRLMLRLVKGAYWDSEIKRAQIAGLDDYPVFTRKAASDLAYLAAATRILDQPRIFYGQFATHNAASVAAIREIAGATPFEYQRLHGMGESLYARILDEWRIPCRVYAPVGAHRDLLAYLVRRLLENGANSSFVNQIADANVSIERLTLDPTRALASAPPSRIVAPRDVYRPSRIASSGIDFGDPRSIEALAATLADAEQSAETVRPIINGTVSAGGAASEIRNPARLDDRIGGVHAATFDEVQHAIALASAAQPAWDRREVEDRAAILCVAADRFEAARGRLVASLVREAGKTIPAAIAELRETVDLLRYYAAEATPRLGVRELPGPTGESNRWTQHGRGVFACIAPWNFPLAIFTGQVAAALVAGNAVLAKPAEQTPIIASRAIALLHGAGIPADVLAYLPGDGEKVGAALVADPRVAGIAFTGSCEVARSIQRGLAARDGAIATLIAETGGINAMIVDSSALLEQAVRDTVLSAFDSAGQRCSALRMLYVQREIYEPFCRMLQGAVAELSVGDPSVLAIDCGPVIDDVALAALEKHAARMPRPFAIAPLDTASASRGRFFSPRAVEVAGIEQLEGEIFGPFLHIARFEADMLESVVDRISARGYGLTMGLHTRIDDTVARVRDRARVGNLYVNRTMIGAVVGTQPFGGEGLSGTGPKAGGPTYLARFATERVVSTDTTAAGGNASLMSGGA